MQERVQSALSIISRNMSAWATFLQLEHAGIPASPGLDDRPLSLTVLMGRSRWSAWEAGENWVGYHLITHFALHNWFVFGIVPFRASFFLTSHLRSTSPRTQDWQRQENGTVGLGEDRQKVERMYRLAYDVVQELNGEFQIIITDHANINQQWFQESVVERWRGRQQVDSHRMGHITCIP